MVSVYTIWGVSIAMLLRYICARMLSFRHILTTIQCKLLTYLFIRYVIGSVW